MYHYHENILTMPATTITNSNVAIIGNPISSVYNAALLNYVHETIKLFLNMEADMTAKGFELLEVLPATTILETFFVDNLDTFKSSQLQSTWTSIQGNLEVPLAERRYKLGKPGTTPLYMKVLIGLKGGTLASYDRAFTRQYCAFDFYSSEDFGVPISSRSLSVHAPSNFTLTEQSARSVKMVYAFNDHAFTIYPTTHAINSLNANILGCEVGFSTPHHWQQGIVVGLATSYMPLAAEEKLMVALLPPQHMGSPTSGDAGLVFGITSTYAYYDGALIVTPWGAEYRGPAVPPISSGIIGGATPGRKFIAPYTHSMLSGSMVAFDSVVWVSNPRRDMIGFSQALYKYRGETRNVTVVPNLMPTVIDTANWNTNIGQFAVGLLQ